MVASFCTNLTSRYPCIALEQRDKSIGQMEGLSGARLKHGTHAAFDSVATNVDVFLLFSPHELPLVV